MRLLEQTVTVIVLSWACETQTERKKKKKKADLEREKICDTDMLSIFSWMEINFSLLEAVFQKTNWPFHKSLHKKLLLHSYRQEFSEFLVMQTYLSETKLSCNQFARTIQQSTRFASRFT